MSRPWRDEDTEAAERLIPGAKGLIEKFSKLADTAQPVVEGAPELVKEARALIAGIQEDRAALKAGLLWRMFAKGKA